MFYMYLSHRSFLSCCYSRSDLKHPCTCNHLVKQTMTQSLEECVSAPNPPLTDSPVQHVNEHIWFVVKKPIDTTEIFCSFHWIVWTFRCARSLKTYTYTHVLYLYMHNKLHSIIIIYVIINLFTTLISLLPHSS